jgi:DNA-binding transcriptional MerR regulator
VNRHGGFAAWAGARTIRGLGSLNCVNLNGEKNRASNDVRNVDLDNCRRSFNYCPDCQAVERVTLDSKLVNTLKVGQVAAEVGVGVQTLHYDERLGLLPKPNRSAANYRLYSSEAVRRVRFIKKAQALGLTLEETKQILDLKDHGREPCRKVAELGENICRKLMDVSPSCAPIAVRLRNRLLRGARKTFPSGIARVSFAI